MFFLSEDITTSESFKNLSFRSSRINTIRRKNLHNMKRFIVFSTDKVFSLDDWNDNLLELSKVIISSLKRNNILERWVSIQFTKAKEFPMV